MSDRDLPWWLTDGTQQCPFCLQLHAVEVRRLAEASDEGGRAEATAADLDELTKGEPYERAEALDIPDRSGMDKRALIRAIRRSA